MPRVLIFPDLDEAKRKIPVGEKRLVRIGERRICLIHRASGFAAVEDACPHLGYSLSKGTLNPFGEIICPWHAYRFSLTSGEEAESRCRDLKTYELLVDSGLSIVLED